MTFCASCHHGKRCAIYRAMIIDPEDRQCQSFFHVGRDGLCSQYKIDDGRR
jgi:hypothetical protein